MANAGVQISGLLPDATESEWDTILGVNLKGVGYSCKAVLATMIEQHAGAIVIISSLNAAIGVAHMPIYDASKAGTGIDAQSRGRGTAKTASGSTPSVREPPLRISIEARGGTGSVTR